jgi:DNA topoisomerase-1
MEEDLDHVEEGKAEWTAILAAFYRQFSAELDRASVEMTAEEGQIVETRCPKCQNPMMSRWTRFGKLLQCECGFKKDPSARQVPGQTCERCGAPMVLKGGRRGKFLACGNYPDCTFTRSLYRGTKVIAMPEESAPKCDKSGHPMAVRVSRRGPFLGCTGYPACRNAKRIPRSWISDLFPKSERAPETTPEEDEENA